MLFKLNKREGMWVLTPDEGLFRGQPIATVDALEMTSVVSSACKVLGTLKAVWGLNLNHNIDLDAHLVRALGIGRPFRGEPGHPLQWFSDRIYDPATGRALSTCARLIINGTRVTRST